eukprot:scaffold260580_cov34-Prasinocladus_malaysianus.AAC.1
MQPTEFVWPLCTLSGVRPSMNEACADADDADSRTSTKHGVMQFPLAGIIKTMGWLFVGFKIYICFANVLRKSQHMTQRIEPAS